MKILALDLGKSKTVACDFDVAANQGSYRKVATTEQALHDLIVDRSPDRVVLEVGPSAGWVHDLARALGVEVQVANPNHEGWRWRNVKRKTDRLDALKLARLSAMDQLPQVHMPAARMRQWRGLIAYRHRLVGRRTQIRNRIRSLLVSQGMAMPSGKGGWTGKMVVWLETLSRPLEQVGMGQLWRGELALELEALSSVSAMIKAVEAKLDAIGQADGRVRLLQTMATVGLRTAEALVATIDDPHRFANGKAVGSYFGLTPRQYQSGSQDRRGRISGQGNGLVRRLLVEVSWLGLRYNPWLRGVYERVRRGSPTRKKIAIVAAARQLVIVAWAMLRDHQPWRPPATTNNN